MKPQTKKKLSLVFMAVAFGVPLAACGGTPADVVSSNLSNAADNFKIDRQIDFVDTITGKNMVTVQGLCSLGNNDVFPNVTVTCKTGEDKKGNGEYIKDFFIVTPTTTVAAVQLGSAEVSSAQYSITWAPGVLVPNFNSPGGAPLTPTPAPASTSTPAPAATSTTSPTTKATLAPATKAVVTLTSQPTPAPSTAP